MLHSNTACWDETTEFSELHSMWDSGREWYLLDKCGNEHPKEEAFERMSGVGALPSIEALLGKMVMAPTASSSRFKTGEILDPQLSEPTHRK